MPFLGGGRAIAERSANGFRRQRALFDSISQNARVREDHPPKPDDIGPAIAHDILRDMGQVLLQITVAGPYQDKVLRRARFNFPHDVNLARHTDQWIVRRLVSI